ncbi:MAG: GntR family transcriptional regulator, partial [Chloroflexi bacterium]|nr:GntR family transcriptional regulator [Chloroflexota bacterium]
MRSTELPANRLHAVLAQKLEDLIMQGAYAPGDRLPPAHELARHYGVSLAVV